MTTKHSRTPYSVDIKATDNGESIRVLSADGGVVCLVKANGGRKMETAKFLARAANCHDDLVAALKHAQEELERLATWGGHGTSEQTDKMIADALAKAKGEA